MLYSACARAAKALGYGRIITYILESESGTSLRASGWVMTGKHEAVHGQTTHAKEKMTIHCAISGGMRKNSQVEGGIWHTSYTFCGG
jgi:hypothetical protein